MSDTTSLPSLCPHPPFEVGLPVAVDPATACESTHAPTSHQEALCRLLLLERATRVAQAKADAARSESKAILIASRRLFCAGQIDVGPYGANGARLEPCRNVPVRKNGLCEACGKAADDAEDADFDRYYEEELSGTPDWTPRSSFATNPQQAYRQSKERADRDEEEKRVERERAASDLRARRLAAGPRIRHQTSGGM